MFLFGECGEQRVCKQTNSRRNININNAASMMISHFYFMIYRIGWMQTWIYFLKLVERDIFSNQKFKKFFLVYHNPQNNDLGVFDDTRVIAIYYLMKVSPASKCRELVKSRRTREKNTNCLIGNNGHVVYEWNGILNQSSQ